MATLAKLSAYGLRVPLERPLLLSNQTIAARDYVIVEAVDDEGVVGRAIGYTRGAPVEAVVERMLVPAWQGQDLDGYAALYDRTVRTHSMQGTHGIFWRAISLADCAVHDLVAQQAGVPLAEFLGGAIAPVTTTLAGCYPIAGETPESFAALMTRMDSFGAAGVKLTGSGDLTRDTERLGQSRLALSGDTALIIDLYNNAPEPAVLLPFARQWSEFGMGWLEDPYGFDDLADLATLADGLPYPVGVGDEQAGLSHFRNLIDFGHVGVVRLDATACGGVTGFLRIAKLATARGRPISCHVFHHLHAQLAAVVPTGSVEYMLPETGVDAVHLLLKEDLRWRDGRLLPAARPGVGYVWDEDALLRYRARALT